MEDQILRISPEVIRVVAAPKSGQLKTATEKADKKKAQPEKEASEHQETAPEKTRKLVEELNRQIQRYNTKIVFSYNPDSNRNIIYVVEKETGKVIRQIPAEKFVHLQEEYRQNSGAILNTNA